MSAYLRPNYRGYFEQTNDREPMCNVLHVLFSHYYVGGRKIWYQAGDTRPIRSDIRLYDMQCMKPDPKLLDSVLKSG